LTKGELIRAIKAERRQTLALVRDLEPLQFDTPTLLPGWRIREVLAHLVTTDRASVLGLNLITLLRSMDVVERWNERQVPKWANRPVPELLLGLDRWSHRLVKLIRAVPGPLLAVRTHTIFGRGPLLLLAWSRVYDEWIHRQDIRRALALPDEAVDVTAAAEFLLTAIETHTLPQVTRPGVVAVSLRDVALPEVRYDLDSRTLAADGESARTAHARIVAPAPAFIMAAAGRDSFADLLARRVIEVEGDRGLGDAFLAQLRIV
jgi:uncharacterized protein (TIGR03083 family)